MSDGLPFLNSDECDDEQPPTAGAPAPRKRSWGAANGNNASLANLAPSKTCPVCSKVHGNAKKGMCKGPLPDGSSCSHVFESAPKQPRLTPGPQQEFVGAVFTHKQLHRQFEKLCEQANRVAQLSGFSAAVMLAGAVSSDQPYTPAAEVVEGDTFVRKGPLLESGMRLVVFKHSSGGAAKLLVDQWEVLEFLAQRVHFNLTGHLADCAPPAQDPKPPKKRRPPASARQAPATTAAAAGGAAAITTTAAAVAGAGTGAAPRAPGFHSPAPAVSAGAAEQRGVPTQRAAPATTSTAAVAAAGGMSVQEVNVQVQAQQRAPWSQHLAPAGPSTGHTQRHAPTPVSTGSRSRGGASTAPPPPAPDGRGLSEAAAAASGRVEGPETGSAFIPWGQMGAEGGRDPLQQSAGGLLGSGTQQQQQQALPPPPLQQQQGRDPAVTEPDGSCRAPPPAAPAGAADPTAAGQNGGGAGSAAGPLTPSPDVTTLPNTGASGVDTPAAGQLAPQPVSAAAGGPLGTGAGGVVAVGAGAAGAGMQGLNAPEAAALAAAAAAAGDYGAGAGALQQDNHQQHQHPHQQQQQQQAYRERQRQHLQLLWQQCQQMNAEGVQLVAYPVVQQGDGMVDPVTHFQQAWQQQTTSADLHAAAAAAAAASAGVGMVPVSTGLLAYPYQGHLMALGSAEFSRGSAATQAAAAAAGASNHQHVAAAAAGGLPPGLQPWSSAGSHLTAGGFGRMSHPGETSVPIGWSDDWQGVPAGLAPGSGVGAMMVSHLPPGAGAAGRQGAASAAGYGGCVATGAGPTEEWLLPLQEQHSSNMALHAQQQQQQQQQGALQRQWHSSPQLLAPAADTQLLFQGGQLHPDHLHHHQQQQQHGQQQQGNSGLLRRPSSRLQVMSGPH